LYIAIKGFRYLLEQTKQRYDHCLVLVGHKNGFQNQTITRIEGLMEDKREPKRCIFETLMKLV